MKRPLKLRKTVDLLNEYRDIASISESLKRTLDRLPEELDISTRVKTSRELVSQRVKKLEILVELIRRFSPTVGKLLQYKLKKIAKGRQEWIEKAVKRQDLSEDLRRKFVNETYALDIIDQWITYTYTSIVETLETARLPLLLQKNEHLEITLRRSNPKYAKMYTAAWQTLKSGNPDACRQCASTLRQLITDLIDEKGTGKDRESKLNNLFKHEEDEKFRKAVVSFVEATMSLLGKAVHKDIGLMNMSFAIIMSENVLLFLLEYDGD